MRVELPRRPRRPETFLLIVVFLAQWIAAARASAQVAPASGLRTTLVVFTERRMKDDQWQDLFDALQAEYDRAAHATPALGRGFDLVRGDTDAKGLQVDNPITVYLHGDCTLQSVPGYAPFGPLGWVWRVHRTIQPFIHVNCAQIEQELKPLTFGMSRNRLNTVMGEAMARVILHEWIHIATQNSGHTSDGVTKSSFGIADLLADDDVIKRDPRFPRNGNGGRL